MPKKAQQEYDNANTGVLFVNDKQGNDKRPDYTGKLLIHAEDYEPDGEGNVYVELAAWKRETKVGEVLSIKAQPPQAE